jgi:type VI secretion system secreted protein VgrG
MRVDHVEFQFECGGAAWRVRAVVLEERLNRPFRAELRLRSVTPQSTAALIGARGELTMTRGDAVRTFRGEVTLADVATDEQGSVATVRFEPRIARLGWADRSRVFQAMTSLEIVRCVLAAGTSSADEPGVSVEGEPVVPLDVREYCVQYDESDLAFASRLLEDDGLAWFVDDTGESSVVRVFDDNRGAPPVPGVGEIRLIPEKYDEAPEMSIQALAFARRPASSGVVERNWTWMGLPTAIDENRWPELAPEPRHEILHPRRNAGSSGLASARREYERRASRDVVGTGTGNVIGFGPGLHAPIALDSGEVLDVLLTTVVHHGDCPEVELGAEATRSGPNYTNTFECQPLAAPHQPQRTVPRPRIHSLHTAVVVGPPDGEIHTDEHGRIRVRMHWDRATNSDAGASCWLRVAQSWAGQGWGSMFIPRVGMEVLVAFLDGDPDRPICIGCVYNGAHRPPYDLPADRTKSTIRTQSSPGGDGYNELTFDDAAGSERVYVRAQRDLDAHVLHDLNTKVDAAETRHVGGHRHTEVGADDVLHVRKDAIHRVDGGHELHVAGSVAVQIDGGPPLGDAAATAPGMTVSIIQGGYRLTAPQRIELVCGPSAILMTPTGVTITGPAAVNVVCGGAMVALAPGALSLAAPVLSIAAPGATLGLGSSATLASPGGVKLECGDECELTLNGRATIMAGEVLIDAGSRFVAMASKVELDGTDEAVMHSEGLVRLADASGSVVLQGGTIALEEPST